MISTEDSEKIINHIRNVWYDFFSNHKIAPYTLVYDPLSQFTGISSGLAHIAHDSKFFSDKSTNPDEQILLYDPKDGPYTTSIIDLNNLLDVECVLMCSVKLEEVNFILSKLKSEGLLIILNETIKVPENYQEYICKANPSIGITKSFTLSRNMNCLDSR